MPWAHDYGTVANTNELLGKIRDFLVGRGWTVADDYSLLAVPFIALRSTGESGDKPFGIMLDRIAGYEGFNTCVFRTWQTVAPYWTPNPGTVKCYNPSGSTAYFDAQAGAPSFTDRFAVGNTLWGFNPTTGSNRHRAALGRMRVSAVTASRLTIQTGSGYVMPGYWDATADPTYILTTGGPFLFARWTDTDLNGNVPTIPGSASSFAYFLFGDKDCLIVVTRIGTAYYGTYVGWVSPYHDPRTTTTLSELVAGVSTSVQVTDPSLFTVGGRYQVMNEVTGHIFRVAAITGNTLTLLAGLEGGLTSGVTYPAGTRVGEDLFPVCRATLKNYNSDAAATFPGDWGTVNCGDIAFHSYNGQGIQHRRNADVRTAFGDYFWPDMRRSQYGFLPMYVGKTGDCRGTLRNVYQLKDTPGNSEDIIRLGGTGGPTYKIFCLTTSSTNYDYWHCVKE